VTGNHVISPLRPSDPQRLGPLPNGGAGLMARLDNGGSAGRIQAVFDNFDLSTIR
jgi:hypothetical protein